MFARSGRLSGARSQNSEFPLFWSVLMVLALSNDVWLGTPQRRQAKRVEASLRERSDSHSRQNSAAKPSTLGVDRLQSGHEGGQTISAIALRPAIANGWTDFESADRTIEIPLPWKFFGFLCEPCLLSRVSLCDNFTDLFFATVGGLTGLEQLSGITLELEGCVRIF